MNIPFAVRFLIGMGVVMSIVLALLPHIVYWLSCLVARFSSHHVPYRPFGLTALVLVVVWLVLLIWGNQVGRFSCEVKSVTYSNTLLPEEFDGYRIVHISDMHLDGWEGHGDALQHVVDLVNQQHPDLICFTGDLVSILSQELDAERIAILRQLRAADGVASVLGNHDYAIYARFDNDSLREASWRKLVVKQREELGWNLLLNEHLIIRRGNDSIALVGVENQSVGVHPVVQRGDLKSAIKGLGNTFAILLSHDPSHWRHEVVPDTDIPLTLSGHTHAWQFRIGSWTPARYAYPECDGMYVEGNQSLYVNVGLGGTLPFRIGASPEITVITLKK